MTSININQYIEYSRKYQANIIPYLDKCFILYNKKYYTINDNKYYLTDIQRNIIYQQICSIQSELNKIEKTLTDIIGINKTFDFMLSIKIVDINNIKIDMLGISNMNLSQLNDILSKNIKNLKFLLDNKKIFEFFNEEYITNLIVNIIKTKTYS